MHVIVVEIEPSSFRGGQELSLLEVCRGLSQRGHKISLLYLKSGDLIEQYQTFCSNIIQIHDYHLDRKNIQRLFNFIVDIFKVPVGENAVVYGNRYHDVFFGYILALFHKASFVCHLRLPPPAGVDRQQATGLQGAKRFITISQQTKLDWVQSGLIEEEKLDVVYNTINSEKFKPPKNFIQTRKEWNLPLDTKVISYIGRLDREKGLETLITAFALLHKHKPNTQLLIAGKPLSTEKNYQDYLEQLCSDLGITQSVNFLGHMSNPVTLYQVSDITVVPSIWPEPFGRVLIESMACGTPVVASRTGGIPEILTGAFQSGLFEPGNAEELCDRLINRLNWRDTSPQLGKQCRDYVLSTFRYDHMVNNIENVLLKSIRSPAKRFSLKPLRGLISGSPKMENVSQPNVWL